MRWVELTTYLLPYSFDKRHFHLHTHLMYISINVNYSTNFVYDNHRLKSRLKRQKCIVLRNLKKQDREGRNVTGPFLPLVPSLRKLQPLSSLKLNDGFLYRCLKTSYTFTHLSSINESWWILKSFLSCFLFTEQWEGKNKVRLPLPPLCSLHPRNRVDLATKSKSNHTSTSNTGHTTLMKVEMEEKFHSS